MEFIIDSPGLSQTVEKIDIQSFVTGCDVLFRLISERKQTLEERQLVHFKLSFI